MVKKAKKKNEPKKLKKADKKDKKGKNKISQATQNVIALDPKLSVDKYFPDRKNYHLFKDAKTRDSSYLSCTLHCINNTSNKLYVIQLLEHDTNKSLKLFSRWGKIDSKGSQEVKSVNCVTGYKLYMKKCQEKIKKGYLEVF